jgi:phage terminase Nu1 subunit (DNA packaging protein)
VRDAIISVLHKTGWRIIMEKTMTIREIADLTGNGKATVQDWVAKMNGNNSISNEIRSSIAAKVTDAMKTKKAAEFTLLETVAIIRAGGNELLATLLEQNAKLSFDDIEVKDEPEHLIFTGPGGNAVNLKTLSELTEMSVRTIRRKVELLGIPVIRGNTTLFDRETAMKVVHMIYHRKPNENRDRILAKVSDYFGCATLPALQTARKSVPDEQKDDLIRHLAECIKILTGK